MRGKGSPSATAFPQLLSGLLLFLLLSGIAKSGAQEASGSTPRITFTKDFPNSSPDYYSVVVQENGSGRYLTSPADDTPLEFQLSDGEVREVFSLAAKLNWFKDRTLESNRRVASMGKKTLSYQKGEEHYESSFNHSEIPEALALTALFEKISQTEQHLLKLQYLIRHDRLGVAAELLRTEIALDQNRLIGAAQLAPVLEQIQNDRSLVRVAQARASQILSKIKSRQQ